MNSTRQLLGSSLLSSLRSPPFPRSVPIVARRHISLPGPMSNTQELKKAFLAQPHFAVVGASKDATKFGTKILKWYQAQGLDVTPVHPKEPELEGVDTVKTLAELPAASSTAVSVVTPPKITLSLLPALTASESEKRVPYLWLQPGTDDDAVRSYITDNGLQDRVIYGGPCVLVEGEGIRAQL